MTASMWFERRDTKTKATSFIREDDLREELHAYYDQDDRKWACERIDLAIDALEIGHIHFTLSAEYRRADPD